jgi:hypothetical protein
VEATPKVAPPRVRPTAASLREVAAQPAQLPIQPSAPGVVAHRVEEDPGLEDAFASAARVGEDRPVGTVDKAHIRRAITAVRPLLAQCLEDVRDRYPPPQKVVLKFTLDGGRFSEGRLVRSSIADPFVEGCVLDSLLDARFTASADDEALTLTYPFRFEQDAG